VESAKNPRDAPAIRPILFLPTVRSLVPALLILPASFACAIVALSSRAASAALSSPTNAARIDLTLILAFLTMSSALVVNAWPPDEARIPLVAREGVSAALPASFRRLSNLSEGETPPSLPLFPETERREEVAAVTAQSRPAPTRRTAKFAPDFVGSPVAEGRLCAVVAAVSTARFHGWKDLGLARFHPKKGRGSVTLKRKEGMRWSCPGSFSLSAIYR
jgi:hypothetical protein